MWYKMAWNQALKKHKAFVSQECVGYNGDQYEYQKSWKHVLRKHNDSMHDCDHCNYPEISK